MVRSGFASLLDTQPDFRVVGTAADGAEAVRLSARYQPDVVLMDIRMPGTDGIAATRQLTSASTRTRILILTTFDLDEYVYDAIRAGASGFLLKDVTAEQLFDAVRVLPRTRPAWSSRVAWYRTTGGVTDQRIRG